MAMKEKNEIEIEDNQNEEMVEDNISFNAKNVEGNPKVYLMYDLPHQLAIGKLKGLFESEGFVVLEPAFEGTLVDRRNAHYHSLITADIILIYYGSKNEQWLQTKLLDVLKSPGLGRKKNITESAIYAPQQVKIADNFASNYQVVLIGEDDIFPSRSLKEFLNKAKKIYAAVSE